MDDLEVLAEYMDRPGPTDLKAIFKKLGIKYREESMNYTSGYICCNSGNFEIVVNKNLSYQRRRFTAAHQLAHYILHRDIIADSDGKCHRDTLWESQEAVSPYPLNDNHDRQANRLAVKILLPASKLSRLIKNGLESSKELTKHFGVSEKVIQLRLETLT